MGASCKQLIIALSILALIFGASAQDSNSVDFGIIDLDIDGENEAVEYEAQITKESSDTEYYSVVRELSYFDGENIEEVYNSETIISVRGGEEVVTGPARGPRGYQGDGFYNLTLSVYETNQVEDEGRPQSDYERGDELFIQEEIEKSHYYRPDDFNHTSELESGWNIISSDISISDLEASCDIDEFGGQSVWTFSQNDWQHPSNLTSDQGHMVYLDGFCEVELPQSEEQQETEYNEGWNMVSTPYKTSFSELETDCEPREYSNQYGEGIIWDFESSSQDWNLKGEYNTKVPEKGYYMYFEESCSVQHDSLSEAPPMPEIE